MSDTIKIGNCFDFIRKKSEKLLWFPLGRPRSTLVTSLREGHTDIRDGLDENCNFAKIIFHQFIEYDEKTEEEKLSKNI